MKKQLLIYLAIFLFIVAGTALVILYGRGYRFGIGGGRPGFSGTGLLVATSNPDGAEVFVNNHLTTATNNTINLYPGDYEIKISKEGYFPWVKKIKIQKEVVSKAEALLLPTTPQLEAVTSTEVDSLAIDPTLTRIAYTVSSQSAKKNGIYVLDMTTKPILTLRSASNQIADDTTEAFSKAKLSWSPDGQQLLATVSATPEKTSSTYLLSASGFNQNPQDVTETLMSVKSQWEKDKQEKEKAVMNGLKKQLASMISDDFKVNAWAYDETKILYEASRSADLPVIIKPRLIGTNSTSEDRSIKKGSIYVYDIKEDKNYKILDSLSPTDLLSWYPDSKHLLYVHDKKINIMDYDGLNQTTIFAGPFIDSYVFPWPNGSKILILTNLGNTATAPNLYTIGLK